MDIQANRQLIPGATRLFRVVATLLLCLPTAALAQPTADINADQMAVFVLERGPFLRSDFGMFMTLGGSAGHSAAQPYLSLAAGVDLSDSWSLQATLGAGFSAGNPLSANNDPAVVGPHAAVNYGLLMAGGELTYAFRPRERLAIEPRLGAGVTWLSTPLASASDASRTISTTSPHVVGGIDIKYLTLLTDFSTGLSLSSYYITAPNVVALSAAALVRYTF